MRHAHAAAPREDRGCPRGGPYRPAEQPGPWGDDQLHATVSVLLVRPPVHVGPRRSDDDLQPSADAVRGRDAAVPALATHGRARGPVRWPSHRRPRVEGSLPGLMRPRIYGTYDPPQRPSSAPRKPPH